MTAENQKMLNDVAKWLARLLVAVLAFLAVDNLTTIRSDVRGLSARIESLQGVDAAADRRITKLETLQPEDRKLLERLDERSQRQGQILAAIAARLNVQADKGGGGN